MWIDNHRLFPVLANEEVEQTIDCQYGPLVRGGVIADIETLTMIW